MDKEMLEYLHNSGLMPDFYYYQVNGKSFSENYIEVMDKQNLAVQDFLFDKRKLGQIEAEFDQQVEEKLSQAIEDALDDIFSYLR